MSEDQFSRVNLLEMKVAALEETVAGLVAILQVIGELQEVKHAERERASELLSASRLGRIPSPLIRFRPEGVQ